MSRKVLVVDDEKLIVKGIRFSLEQDGMEVDCAYDGEEAVEKAKDKKYDIILLDLMLPKGLIVYTEDKNGKKTEMKSDEEHQFTKPLAVLVNGNSASASEIYSGAIQDYGIGKIVGTQTYGKGVVQQIFDLDDGTAVKLTIAEYFTPKGRSINGKGITPDVKVEYENNEENPDADNQLDKSVEEVKAQMK